MIAHDTVLQPLPFWTEASSVINLFPPFVMLPDRAMPVEGLDVVAADGVAKKRSRSNKITWPATDEAQLPQQQHQQQPQQQQQQQQQQHRQQPQQQTQERQRTRQAHQQHPQPQLMKLQDPQQPQQPQPQLIQLMSGRCSQPQLLQLMSGC